ncbi:MAG: hypothetical protein GY710_02000 [Desulfobacteraceae bacterium]|nr:hypothetical protein [Desulfobacteraceae bacterium]
MKKVDYVWSLRYYEWHCSYCGIYNDIFLPKEPGKEFDTVVCHQCFTTVTFGQDNDME